MTEQNVESFDDFRKSFSYGSRTDLLFKFLGSPNVSDGEAADFFQKLLERIGDAADTGDFSEVLQHVYDSQVTGYTPREQMGNSSGFSYDTAPWTPMTKPLAESKLALISAGGLYVHGDDPLGPKGPSQAEAIPRIGEFLRSAPVLSTIPLDTPPEMICVRHPGYDIRGTLRDYNVVFPVDRLRELRNEGIIGELSDENYSFVGASSQKRLLSEGAPVWAEKLKDRGVDAALLVAA